MDRTPFSAFLLLLVGLVLLAQFVSGSLWSFLDGLLGTNTASVAETTPPVGGAAKGAVTTRSGDKRTGTVAA